MTTDPRGLSDHSFKELDTKDLSGETEGSLSGVLMVYLSGSSLYKVNAKTFIEKFAS